MEGKTDKRKDGQTDMRNVIVAFRNFGKPPKSITITPASKYALFRAFQMDIPSYFNDTTDDYGMTCLFQG
jgi:hypothetical protein